MDHQDRLINSHIGLAHSIAYDCFLGRKSTISLDEIKSESFLGLLKALENFDPQRGVSFGAFAKVVIQNHLRDFFRSEQSRNNLMTPTENPHSEESFEDEFYLSSVPLDQIDPSRESYRNEVRQTLKQELSKLGPNQRKVLELVAEGYSYSEIAEKLLISKQAAQQAAKRAMQNIKENINDKGFDFLFCPDKRYQPKTSDERDIPDLLKIPDLGCSPQILYLLIRISEDSKSDESQILRVSQELKVRSEDIHDVLRLLVFKAKAKGYILLSDREKLALEEQKRIETEKIRRQEKIGVILLTFFLILIFLAVLIKKMI
jgi:RNA polymerase sigma factor (sigma-70 family)